MPRKMLQSQEEMRMEVARYYKTAQTFKAEKRSAVWRGKINIDIGSYKTITNPVARGTKGLSRGAANADRCSDDGKRGAHRETRCTFSFQNERR